MIKYIPFITPLVILVLVIPSLTGCGGGSSPPPPDFPNLASAFKFVGCCSVVCALIWDYAIVKGSNNRRGGG